MKEYRKLLLDAYAFMFFARVSYIHLGFEICLLDELKELKGYMEGETFQMEILGTMKDRAVLRIHRFAQESNVLLEKIYQDNNFLDEEIMDYEYDEPPKGEGEMDRIRLLAVLCLYTEREVSKITELINKLCILNNEPPLNTYPDIGYYEDENIKLLSTLYTKAVELHDDIIETEIADHE
jgi:hypothetical protein